jgi:hypothetical protein
MPDVAAHRDTPRPQPVGIGSADAIDRFGIEFAGHAPADVIGLEAAAKVHALQPALRNCTIESTTY